MFLHTNFQIQKQKSNLFVCLFIYKKHLFKQAISIRLSESFSLYLSNMTHHMGTCIYNPLIFISRCSLSSKISEEEGNLLGASITLPAGIQLLIPHFLGTCREVCLFINLGFMIGFTATYIQQWISNFLRNSKLLAKHYQPPTSLAQDVTWFRAVTSLQSFNKGLKDARQLALYGSLFDMGLKLAVFRQFNSGWQNNFGGVQYNYYRKIPTIFASFLVTSPFAVVGQMALRAYRADKTFPVELQKGYSSYFNTLRRIPFEQGPYYLFRNTFPLFAKHSFGPFTSFYSYDWLIDKLSVIWRTANNPVLPVKLFAATFSTWLGVTFSYPFAHAVREMVDLWPKKNGVDLWKGNYRKAAVSLWYGPSWNIGFAGLYQRYFWNVAPLYFLSLMLADQFGLFSYWRIDILGGASDNTADDSYI